jgi:hypothetical protein
MNTNMPSWLPGFLAGVVATIFGFVLTMIWDIYKNRRDTKTKETAIIRAIKEELITNLAILENDEKILTHELTILEKDLSLVAPLESIFDGTWDLLKINLPQKLTANDLVSIRVINQMTNQINENIKSRENYRINNLAMDNYSSRLKKYDEGILDMIANLKLKLKDIDSWL